MDPDDFVMRDASPTFDQPPLKAKSQGSPTEKEVADIAKRKLEESQAKNRSSSPRFPVSKVTSQDQAHATSPKFLTALVETKKVPPQLLLVGPTISTLHLSGKTLSSADISFLARCYPNVTALHLSNCSLTSQALFELGKFQHLQAIDLSGYQKFALEGLEGFVTTHPKLTDMQFTASTQTVAVNGRTPLISILKKALQEKKKAEEKLPHQLKVLQEMEKLGQLEILSSTGLLSTWPSNSATFSNMECIDQQQASTLAHLCPHLTSLTLSECSIGGGFLSHLSRVLPNINAIDLSKSTFHFGVSLEYIHNFKELEILKVNDKTTITGQENIRKFISDEVEKQHIQEMAEKLQESSQAKVPSPSREKAPKSAARFPRFRPKPVHTSSTPSSESPSSSRSSSYSQGSPPSSTSSSSPSSASSQRPSSPMTSPTNSQVSSPQAKQKDLLDIILHNLQIEDSEKGALVKDFAHVCDELVEKRQPRREFQQFFNNLSDQDKELFQKLGQGIKKSQDLNTFLTSLQGKDKEIVGKILTELFKTIFKSTALTSIFKKISLVIHPDKLVEKETAEEVLGPDGTRTGTFKKKTIYKVDPESLAYLENLNKILQNIRDITK
ncbi:MAG: hypothetical protein JWO53_1368 [Chlamydiia bacterium]|nr:hypothetical protein [Chlamydiia bacterium]